MVCGIGLATRFGNSVNECISLETSLRNSASSLTCTILGKNKPSAYRHAHAKSRTAVPAIAIVIDTTTTQRWHDITVGLDCLSDHLYVLQCSSNREECRIAAAKVIGAIKSCILQSSIFQKRTRLAISPVSRLFAMTAENLSGIPWPHTFE